MPGAHLFACDLRSLALFRVGLGLTVLFELCAHDGDAGVRGALIWAAVPAALLLAIGYRCQLSCAACWLLLAALHAGSPVPLDQGDALLVILLLIGIALPLGQRFAVDAALDPEPEAGHRVASIATVALLLQLCLFFAGGSARWAASHAADGPAVLQALGYLGFAAPLLLLAPKVQDVSRGLLLVLVLAALGGAWLQLGSHDELPVVVVALAAIVPGALWERLSARIDADPRRALRIYFDRDCGFCFKTCLMLRTLLILGKTPIEPAQSDPAVHAIMEQHNSWVVFDHDASHHVRWHAIMLLLRRSPLVGPLGSVLTRLGMGRWCDGIYELVARNRSRLGGVTAWLLPFRRQSARPGRSATIAIAIWILLAIGVGWVPIDRFSALRHAIGLDQRWQLVGIAPEVDAESRQATTRRQGD